MAETSDDDPGSGVVVQTVELSHRHARLLEARHIEDMKSRYGGRGPGPVSSAEFLAPTGRFLLATIDGVPVGCGGVRRLTAEVAEIKRMFVDPGARRRGVGRRLLGRLESFAREAGHAEVWLETGSEQPEAIALYTAAGYRPIAPYGEFKGDGRSRCFSRRLGS